MKKSNSMKDYMYSRAKVGAPKGNLGGEPDTRYPASEIQSKKLEKTPIKKMETPSNPKVDMSKPSEGYKKHIAALDKEGRRKASIRNLKKFGAIVGGGAATLVGGYYGLTRKPTAKETKSAGREYRRWRWNGE